MQSLTFLLGGPAFFVRTFALGYVDHGPHEFTHVAGLVEDRMAHDVNVPDSFVRMNDSVVQFEIRLLADGFPEPFPAMGLIVRMNPLKEGFESCWQRMRAEPQYPKAILRPVSDATGRRTPRPTPSMTQ